MCIRDSDSAVPVSVSGLSGATQISGGRDHTCALVAGGQARCWGRNFDGKLGNGTSGSGSVTSTVPVAVAGLSGASQVSAGDQHTCALVAGGQARCWGDNSTGQLGDGTFVDSPVPIPVTGLSGASALDSGIEHTCAVVAGGQARCWGSNAFGNLGDGRLVFSTSPSFVV